MTTGDGEVDGGAIPLPRRSGSDAPITLRSAGATALLDTVVPPWLRVPGALPVRRAVDDSARRAGLPVPVPQARPRSVDGPRAGGPVHRPSSARPRVEPEAGMIGLSRLTRTRVGSRLFTLFFVAVFALIFVQMCVVLLRG